MDEGDCANHTTATGAKEDAYYFEGGRLLANPAKGEEITISGIAGTFPNSKDIHEFRENLFNKVNMVLPNRRWDYNHPEIPVCSGTIPEINKYDAGFFGVHERQSHSLDTLTRIFQEKVIEAIFDAGLHPTDLENTKTGVYVGVCSSENDKAWYFDNLSPQNFAITGSERSMVAHRISYFLKLKGPSCILDAACSSSFYGLENAYKALRLGEIDKAIVGGTNLCLHPFTTMQFLRLGVLSKDGSCKAFDIQGNGYARSEGFGVLILQKAREAKRIYARIIHVKANCDGYKEQGITFPSKEAQTKLLTEFYEECEVDRYSLSFLEAHGTGTKVGDPEECAAVDQVLTKGRKRPLLIGSVKSNIGHSEPASGVCSTIKCILAMETGYIPPNIHFKTPKREIKGLHDGRMRVVVNKIPLEDNNGLMGVNNFGFGGANVHALFKWNPKKKVEQNDGVPRLVLVSGRTEEAIKELFDQVARNATDVEYIKLLHEVFRKPIQNHLYRGYIIVPKYEEILKSFGLYSGYQKPLYFAFGEFNNWHEVGNQLMPLPAFSNAIQRIQKILSAKSINISDFLLDEKLVDRDFNSIVCSTAVQIALVQILNLLDIKPVATFGYSFGQLIVAYCDGILTIDEAIKSAYTLNEVLSDEQYNLSQVRKRQIINGNCTTNGDFVSSKGRSISDFKDILKLKKSKMEQILLKELPNEMDTVNGLIESILNTNCHENENIEPNSVIVKFGEAPFGEIDDVCIISIFANENKNHLAEFSDGLGKLYLHGHNPQISRLYPEINFPVNRGTPMISPYIRWKHTREIFVPHYSLDIIRQAKHGIKQYRIQAVDHQWAFVTGHVIDGRNLFPATGYLYLVWEAFVVMNGIPLNVSRVSMENCKFIRATNVPENGSIILRVAIQFGSGNFEVTEGNSTLVTGRISLLPDSGVKLYSCKSNGLFVTNDTYLDKKDVYKELRLRGYNYSGEFRGIEKCTFDASKGFVKWDENWVAFMDNMLQLKILQLDTRMLYVPTFISKINIAADAHCELVKEAFKNTGESQNLPVYRDIISGEIKCGGITISGLLASSIARKKNLGIPVLEMYIFVPNITESDIQKSVRVNMQILLENVMAYKVKVVELIDEFTEETVKPLTPMIKSALEDEPLVQSFVKILSKRSFDVDVEVENKQLDSETDCLLVIASRILNRPEILTQAFAALKENGFIISREKDNYSVKQFTNPDITVLTMHKTPSETILLLQKRSQLKSLRCIKVDLSENFSWLSKVQAHLNATSKYDVILYSEKDQTSGILGLVKCLRREPGSRNVRCIFFMDDNEEFDLSTSHCSDQLKKNMAFNVFKDGQWGTYRHILLDNPKVIESEHCFVNTTVKGDLSSLKWIQGSLRNDVSEQDLVYVYYASLNFRDIMVATGKINEDLITLNRLEQVAPGLEFSGRDKKGNRVMGSLAKGALTNLLIADPSLAFPVPDEWTLEEAATVPVVYTTVLYALISRGQMKKGASILIHSGTGGIGQAAIRLAIHYECEIFTTVGTQEKREFLKRTYPQLKDENIGNSHDESFEQMIYRETRGQGVDIVLNSLAEDKLIASVRCLASGGTFLEIGKYDLISNNYVSLLLFEKQASFHGIMLDRIFEETPKVKQGVKKLVQGLLSAGAIKPLNRNIFNCDEIEQAFRFMASGKHMGKVLIKIREPEECRVCLSSLQKLDCLPRYYCDPQKVYTIVGGLGGFGLELADWLILRGARRLMLTSRHGIRTGYQNFKIRRFFIPGGNRLWRSYGIIVNVSTAPLDTREGCKQIIKESFEMGCVAAIFNLAVVLADVIFENQTSTTFATSFVPKAFATQYLDELTRKMCPDLSDFVVFSSVSCGRGNAGQTNYGMANSVMERICEKRRQDGFPSLAIEWGAVGQVGLVAEMQEDHRDLEITGTLQQRVSSCLEVLDDLLTQRDAVIVSSMVVAEKRKQKTADNIVDAVINIIGLHDSKCVSLHSSLAELGMDSMTAVEIKQVLERDFEIFLSARDMRTMTLAKLKECQADKEEAVEESQQRQLPQIGMEGVFRILEDESKSMTPCVPMSPQKDQSHPKIVLFPGIEGFAKVFDEIASHLENAVAMQYVLDGNTTSVAGIVKSVIPIVEKLLPKEKPFTVVAYSYGTLVALEIVHILESRGYYGTLICLDGAPLLMKSIFKSVNMDSEELFQSNIICQLLSFCIPYEEIAKKKDTIINCRSWEERVNIGLDLLQNSTPHRAHYLKTVANTVYRRLKNIETYVPSCKNLTSNVKLFKPNYSFKQGIVYDYGLSEFFTHPVEVQCFEGNHETILQNEKLVEAIISTVQSNKI